MVTSKKPSAIERGFRAALEDEGIRITKKKFSYKKKGCTRWFEPDFVIEEIKRVIEVDGKHHQNELGQILADELRDATIRKHGYKVDRVTTSELNNQHNFYKIVKNYKIMVEKAKEENKVYYCTTCGKKLPYKYAQCEPCYEKRKKELQEQKRIEQAKKEAEARRKKRRRRNITLIILSLIIIAAGLYFYLTTEPEAQEQPTTPKPVDKEKDIADYIKLISYFHIGQTAGEIFNDFGKNQNMGIVLHDYWADAAIGAGAGGKTISHSLPPLNTPKISPNPPILTLYFSDDVTVPAAKLEGIQLTYEGTIVFEDIAPPFTVEGSKTGVIITNNMDEAITLNVTFRIRSSWFGKDSTETKEFTVGPHEEKTFKVYDNAGCSNAACSVSIIKHEQI